VSRVRKIGLAVIVLAALGGVTLSVVKSQPAWYLRLRYPLRYETIVRGHARNYRLDPALLAAVIYTESKFDASARSQAGAVGLMQLLPETAEGIAARTGGAGFVVSDLDNPEINVRYGAWYLRHLLDKYGVERTALAAYHAGQANVDRWRVRGEGIQFAQTRYYVEKVERLKRIYRKAYGGELGA
jgi:soluble lytic murein transglycosylase